MNYSVKRKGQGKIFKNPYLEVLTKTNPILTILTYGGIIGVLIYYSWLNQLTTIAQGIQLYLAGLFFWTLGEYLIHRFVFHILDDSKISQKLQYMLHGVHHEYPYDKERIFMPPVPGIIIISMLFPLFFLFLGKFTFIFLAAFINGYLLYASIHYGTHNIRKPPIFFRSLWYYHNLHHFKYEDKVFGVSSTLWDHIFGTMPPKEDRYKSRKRK